MTAAEFLLDKARLRAVKRVSIAGVTGAAGSTLVQIAAHLGAEVTATVLAQNIYLARQFGAAHAPIYRAHPPKGPFDVIADVMATHHLPDAPAPAGPPQGRLCLVTANWANTQGAALTPKSRPIAGTSGESRAQMQRLIDLHLVGACRSHIGQTRSFADLRRAQALAETFHNLGNLLVAM